MRQPERAGGTWPQVLDDVIGALEALTAVLDFEDDLQILLQRVCDQVTAAVPGIDEASVTLDRDGEWHTAAATAPVVVALDRDQYRIGDGPCLRALRGGDLVRVSAAEAVARWPAFGRNAAAAGFESFLSAPLVAGDDQRGAINGYGTREHGFAGLDERILELYTTAVEAILRVHRRYAKAKESAEHLRAALDSRAVIDQAKGILMAVHRIDAAQAFARLVEQSQRENVKLRALAERFIAEACADEG